MYLCAKAAVGSSDSAWKSILRGLSSKVTVTHFYLVRKVMADKESGPALESYRNLKVNLVIAA